ncbi:MAG: haloacid dehalogenase-like hydrolase [Novosphingobium pentaromativorans]|uniref:Haloacid dehalogenase-like hydrolase n=1 Tax=Novosphingobium pentaromativorans TaxID=205844 RepID=A0A2W5NT49_9SPHN|nr:HAD family hydrolase [Novosphingobium panipatense]PZQ56144.1 MAG: haloacid dehalogenase-like hydrolase [Novosphingobium pentaromativorans]
MNAEPLASWRDGKIKSAIVRFVERITAPGGPDFLPPADRVATFDNDGTLWCERPLQAQLYFAHDRLEKLAAADPSLRERESFRACLDVDVPAIKRLGKQGIFEAIAAAHAGITQDAFDTLARDWINSAQNPKLGRRFRDLAYGPQLELLAYLRAHDFRIFVVSAGGTDLMRSFSEEVYGIPRANIIGSYMKTRVEQCDGVTQLIKLAELGCFNDREAKPQSIDVMVGRRPILAFGNSDGDLAMLRYTVSGEGPRLALLLHHDDAEREFAYDRDFVVSPLAEALDRAAELGIHVVSMKHDWSGVFADPT